MFDRRTETHRSRGVLVPAALAVVLVVGAVWAYANRGLFLRLFGPPAVTMREKYDAGRGAHAFDHSALDALLREHVREGGRVDYASLKADVSRLDRYIDSIGEADFEALGRDDKLALLINAYNAFTLKLILEHYPGIDSIRDIPSAQRWDARRWRVGSAVWSLNEIEHEQIRTSFREPRIHFALVCAAVGCPPLRREAYDGGRLDEQLEDQTKRVHESERWFRFDADRDEVWLTRLYEWYGGDFEQASGSVLRFAARYSAELAAALDAGREPAIRWIPYDWKLNDLATAGGTGKP